jgi:pimeloyl-ACP methyl ester carboxylesterase
MKRGVEAMANIILLGGTNHGGWYFDEVAANLKQARHNVFAPHLSGLDPAGGATGPINLDTHIQDVLKVIENNGLADVVLVGHSYAGMVITGVADRTNAEVKGLVYLDAPVPKPGERLWDIVDEGMHQMWLASSVDGLNIYPHPDFKAVRPNLMPHPLGTKMQALNYSEDVFNCPTKVYVYAEEYFGIPEMKSPFTAYYERLKSTPGWKAHSWPHGHDLIAQVPDKVAALILETVDGI